MTKIKQMEYFFLAFTFLVCLYLHFKNKRLKLEEIPSHWLYLAFISKVLASFSLWYIYTYYYPDKSISDIYKYFNDGHQLALIFKNSPSDFIRIITGNLPIKIQNIELYHQMKFWVKPNTYGIYNDNQTIILVASIFNLITNNTLLLAMLYMSICSFFATIILYKSLSRHIQWKQLFFILLFFLPSISFWTSGLLKESLIFCSLSLLIYFGVKIIEKFKWFTLACFSITSFGLLISKTYLFGFILPSISIIYIIYLLKINNVKIAFLSLYCFIILFIITWTYTHNPVIYNYQNKSEAEKTKEYNRVNQISYQQNVLGNNYNLLEMLRFKQADYKHEARLAKAKSLINTKKIDGQLSNFFACIPYGLSNGFARPHLLEANNPMLVLPAIENLLILFLLLVMFIFPRKLDYTNQILVFAFGTFIVITFIFLGLLVPVLGNLVRYKAPLLPLLIYCLLMLIDKNKLLAYLTKFRGK